MVLISSKRPSTIALSFKVAWFIFESVRDTLATPHETVVHRICEHMGISYLTIIVDKLNPPCCVGNKYKSHSFTYTGKTELTSCSFILDLGKHSYWLNET